MGFWTVFVLAVLGMAPLFGQAAAGNSNPIQNETSKTANTFKTPYNPPVAWSLGYLGLVTDDAPNDTILRWDAGYAECPNPILSPVFRMKNFGAEAITLCAPVEPISPSFARETECNCFASLGPGETSGCTLQITFAPYGDGPQFDTLRIETDAQNSFAGYLRIPISGIQRSTPAAPSLVISIVGYDAHLYWHPVVQSINGCSINTSGYQILYSPDNDGDYQPLRFTPDTTFLHSRVILSSGGLFYRIVAMTSAPSDSSSIQSGGTVVIDHGPQSAVGRSY